MKLFGKLLLLLSAAVFLTGPVVVLFGQAVVQVDFDKAILTWDAPSICTTPGDPVGCGGTPDNYNVKCKVRQGADLPVLAVPHPTTATPVSTVIPGPGKYECFVTSINPFGESGGSNVLPFDAGSPPGSPANLGLSVSP